MTVRWAAIHYAIYRTTETAIQPWFACIIACFKRHMRYTVNIGGTCKVGQTSVQSSAQA
jgi:hypothetical protein